LGTLGKGEIGRVIEKGLDYLMLDTSLGYDITAEDYTTMSVKLLPSIEIASPGVLEIGKSIPTAQRIPKNVTIRINYHNHTGTSKRVLFYIEHLY